MYSRVLPFNFTFTFGAGDLSQVAQRPIQSGPVSILIPDITKRYKNLFEFSCKP